MFRPIASLALLLSLPALAYSQSSNSFTQSNLVSDGSIPAHTTDPQLINPWGMAIGQQTPFWINTAGSGLSEVYDSGGNKQFVVQIPPGGGQSNLGSPAGIAFNPSTTDFIIPHSTAALFIFGSLDGTISAWNASLTNAQVVVDGSSDGTSLGNSYTGLAIENNGTANYILAANFAQNGIDVYETEFAHIGLAGHFVDPAVPQGYAPFNVHVLNNQIYVMYAMQTPGGGPPTVGDGAGYVSVFDLNGNLLHHAIAGGKLNAPWGITMAPASFGAFGGDLLIGNFGDGKINAFDPTTFAFKGQLQNASGNPIQNDRMWELVFGQNGTGDPNTLYFTAGVNDERGGLFGAITATGPAPAGDFRVDISATTLTVPRGGSAMLQLNVQPTNGFQAPVTLSASGLPAGATFQFSPASVTPQGGQSVLTQLTITAGSSSTGGGPGPYSISRLSGSGLSGPRLPGGSASKVAAGAILPLGLLSLLPAIRRKRKGLGISAMLGGVFSLVLLSLSLAGCSGSKTNSTGPTPVPVGTSTVTVTATSGSLSHTTTFTLTVQ
jgi:uncharacterized protein (TIGR03118 family)